NYRPDWHPHNGRLGRFAVHHLSLAMPTVLCPNNRLIEEIGEMIGVLIGTEHDVTAAPAIAPVRSSLRNKFLAAKTYASTATLAGLGKNSDPIHEHRFGIISRLRFVRCLLFRLLRISNLNSG